MSPERRLIMAVFLHGAKSDPDWREYDPESYFRIASLAGIPRKTAEIITHDEVVKARANFESLLNYGEL